VVAAAAQAFEADRIVVLGCVGNGKSTLAAVLAARLGAVHIRRDCLGLEGSDQYRHRAAAAVSGDRWVFDGAPYYIEEVVYRWAGLIVGFDLPRRVVMRRVVSPVAAREPQVGACTTASRSALARVAQPRAPGAMGLVHLA
jgi:adenylate kinase family enzyme